MKACSGCGVTVGRKGRCFDCRKARRAEARVLAPSYAFKCQGCGAKRRSQAMFCRACKPEGRGGRKTIIPCPRCGSTVVFRDSAFVDDVAKTNLAAILQQHGLETVRSL